MEMTTNTLVESVASEYNRIKEEFCNQWFKKLIPPVVYRWAHEGKNTQFVMNYLKRNGYCIQEQPSMNLIRIVQHDKVIAELKINFSYRS